jgi:hypothetical protein
MECGGTPNTILEPRGTRSVAIDAMGESSSPERSLGFVFCCLDLASK